MEEATSHDTSPALPGSEHIDEQTLPVVGIGASAGGLKAVQQFLAHTPSDSGMAFVVILHLSPEYESNAAELLQAHTSMPVTQVNEEVPVKPNHVYVIPPAKQLSMVDGHIHLSRPENLSSRRAPIDLFFRTLADTHGRQAAAVILSGMGADGTLGIRRIKETGGVALAQDTHEAEYDSMPHNAIATRLVDFVLPVAEMPQALITFRRNAEELRLPSAHEASRASDAAALDEVLTLLRQRTGHDFAHYKRATVLRRLGRRMQMNNTTDIPAYLKVMQNNADEVQALLHDLLISVTNFFRDPEVWQALENVVVPQLFTGKGVGDQVRVWVPGCATGEEAFSLAMLLREYAARLDQPPDIQVFATDIDEDAIARARDGRFPETIATDISAERLRHFFVQEQQHYRINKDICNIVLFAHHNVLRDPAFSKLDLITCRNLLIYLNRDIQERLLHLFHFTLRPKGFLMLGTSESTDSVSNLYTVTDKQHRIFQRRMLEAAPPMLPSMPLSGLPRERATRSAAPSPQPPQSMGELHQRLLAPYAPPSAIVDEEYDVIHLSDRADRFLQFAGGEPTYNVLKVVHPDLRIELRTALFGAVQKNKRAEARRVRMERDGVVRLVNLHVQPVQEPEWARGHVLVIFDEVSSFDTDEEATGEAEAEEPIAQQLEEELQRTKEQLRLTIEQYETSNEEFKATNEEPQAINEELRAATEELETSKEELQSVNEELLSVNQELKHRIEEVNQTNSDLQNLLAATDIGTLFLDHTLRIKRYTPNMEKIFNLIPSDINRPLAHVTHKLLYDGLPDDARQVLERAATVEHAVASASGRWYLVQLLPYRTTEDAIEGVVITFVDITRRKQAEQSLRESEMRLRSVLEQMPAGVLITNPNGAITFGNQMVEQTFGGDYPRSQSIADYAAWQAYTRDEQLYQAEQLPLGRALLNGEIVTGEELRFVQEADDAWLIVTANAAPIRDSQGDIVAGVLTFVDITARRREEEALLRLRQQTTLILESISDGYISITSDWRCAYINQAMERLLGIARDAVIGQDVHRALAETEIAQHMPQYEQAMDTRVTLSFERYYETLNRWVEERIFPTEDGAITIYQRDITEQKQAEQSLRESEELVRLLNENLEDYALIIMDEQGRVFDWNVGAERIFGYTEQDMKGQTLDCIFTPDDQAAGAPQHAIETARTTGRSANDRWQLRKDGTQIWVNGLTTALRAADGQLRGFAKLARDITERRAAEAALQHSEERLRIALTAAQMGTWDWDITTNTLHLDAQTHEILGLTPDATTTLFEALDARMHPDDRATVHAEVTEAINSGDTYRVAYRIVTPHDQQTHWIALEGRVLRDGSGQPTRITGVVTDISERKAAETALQQSRDELERRIEERTFDLKTEIAERQRIETLRKKLMRQLVVAQEEERRRIARELHDQMGQQLAALSLGLKTLEDSSNGRATAIENIKRLRGISDDLGQEVHRLALDLRPTALDDLGLVTALQTYAEQWSEQTQITVEFHSTGMNDLHLPMPVASTMYRVAQEALTNIMKHAGARHVSLILEHYDSSLVAIVEDDGRGFDVEAAQHGNSEQRLGLQGMQERVALLDGTLTIESSPDSGTTVFVRVPLPPAAVAKEDDHA